MRNRGVYACLVAAALLAGAYAVADGARFFWAYAAGLVGGVVLAFVAIWLGLDYLEGRRK